MSESGWKRWCDEEPQVKELRVWPLETGKKKKKKGKKTDCPQSLTKEPTLPTSLSEL